MSQNEETIFAIVADGIVASPRLINEKWLAQGVPELVRQATIEALESHRDRPDSEIVEATIQTLQAKEETDLKAAGRILDWARSNALRQRTATV